MGTGWVSITYDPTADACSTPAPAPVTSASTSTHGYWLVGSDGASSTSARRVLRFDGRLRLQRPVVGISPPKTTVVTGSTHPTAASSLSVMPASMARSRASGCIPPGRDFPNSLNAPIVGMVPSADGGGYFMVASDGGVFAFGDANFEGSCPGIGGCAGTAVAVMPDASGNGYWLVTKPGTSTASVTPPTTAPRDHRVAGDLGRPYAQWRRIMDPHRQRHGLRWQRRCLSGAPEDRTVDCSRPWPSSPRPTVRAMGGRLNGAVENFGDAPKDGSMIGTHLNGVIVAATGF